MCIYKLHIEFDFFFNYKKKNAFLILPHLSLYNYLKKAITAACVQNLHT
jgi:hypothetical protein